MNLLWNQYEFILFIYFLLEEEREEEDKPILDWEKNMYFMKVWMICNYICKIGVILYLIVPNNLLIDKCWLHFKECLNHFCSIVLC